MNTQQIGVLAAKAIAKVERDFADDEREWEVGDVVVLVEMNAPFVEPGVDEETTADFPMVETRTLKVCTSPRWAVERGILQMAIGSLDFQGYGGEE